MIDLVVIGFDDQHTAFEMRAKDEGLNIKYREKGENK